MMLDIIRRFVDKTLPAVFCNTGNEYPEVVKFVRQMNNVTVIR
ncbi:MAG: phosphoadenosine phosphosulfate reductase, partial [Prevotellaceae bacterium]|nr:phosphoadenosine phosphosulfate reductase [Prevotellaceae bacterium]